MGEPPAALDGDDPLPEPEENEEEEYAADDELAQAQQNNGEGSPAVDESNDIEMRQL